MSSSFRLVASRREEGGGSPEFQKTARGVEAALLLIESSRRATSSSLEVKAWSRDPIPVAEDLDAIAP